MALNALGLIVLCFYFSGGLARVERRCSAVLQLCEEGPVQRPEHREPVESLQPRGSQQRQRHTYNSAKQ